MSSSAPSLRTPLLSALGRSWWVLMLYGIAAIVFGAIALMRPVSAAAALAWTAGVMALFEAGISLAAVFGKEPPGISKGWLLLYTVVSALFGWLAITRPLAVAGSMALLVAVWLVVAGIYRIVFAIRVRKAIRGEWWLILSGALAIVLGLLFAADPLAGMLVTTLWIGAGALVYGVFQVFAAFQVRKLA